MDKKEYIKPQTASFEYEPTQLICQSPEEPRIPIDPDVEFDDGD